MSSLNGSTLFVCMGKLIFDASIYMKQMTSADGILTVFFVTCKFRLTLNAAALTLM